MGIKSLSTILNNYAKNSIKNVTLDSFRGKNNFNRYKYFSL